MIAQENVTSILTTCNVVEKGVKKCEKFWPSEGEDNSHYLDKGTTVKIVGEKHITDHLIARTF